MDFDEIPTEWEIYDGPLRCCVVIRLNGHLMGYVADRSEAVRFVITYVTDRAARDDGAVFMMAA